MYILYFETLYVKDVKSWPHDELMIKETLKFVLYFISRYRLIRKLIKLI